MFYLRTALIHNHNRFTSTLFFYLRSMQQEWGIVAKHFLKSKAANEQTLALTKIRNLMDSRVSYEFLKAAFTQKPILIALSLSFLLTYFLSFSLSSLALLTFCQSRIFCRIYINNFFQNRVGTTSVAGAGTFTAIIGNCHEILFREGEGGVIPQPI